METSQNSMQIIHFTVYLTAPTDDFSQAKCL